MPEWKVRYCVERLGGERGVRRARRLYKKGLPVREIARRLGLKSPECIYAVVEASRRGPYRGRARITPEVEDEVVWLRLEGLSMPKIAERLGISVGSVYRVLRKRGLAGGRSGEAGGDGGG